MVSVELGSPNNRVPESGESGVQATRTLVEVCWLELTLLNVRLWVVTIARIGDISINDPINITVIG